MPYVEKETATLASVMDQAITNRLKEVHTCLPGIIRSYDHTSFTASVEIVAKRVFVDRSQEVERETPVKMPILVEVPVMFPHGGNFHMLFPVSRGDACVVYFSERDFSRWYGTSKISAPDSKRTHSLSDSICFVGIYPKQTAGTFTSTSATDLQIRSFDNKISITMTPTGNIHILSNIGNAGISIDSIGEGASINLEAAGTDSVINVKAATINLVSATEITLTAPDVKVVGDITHTGSQVTSGDVTASGISLNSHVHGGVDPGSGTSGGPQ